MKGLFFNKCGRSRVETGIYPVDINARKIYTDDIPQTAEIDLRRK